MKKLHIAASPLTGTINESAFHHVGIAPGKPAVISIVEF